MNGVWQAVLQATSPRDIVDRKVPGVEAMQAARDEVTEEVNKNARMPPKFSADGECSLSSPCIACLHRSACSVMICQPVSCAIVLVFHWNVQQFKVEGLE